MDKPKIRLCVPCPNHGGVSRQTLASIEEFRGHPDWDADVCLCRGTTIATQRCAGVNFDESSRISQNMDYSREFDYYLAVDGDIVFTPGNVRQLLAHNLDIVGGAYLSRPIPEGFTAGNFFDDTRVVSHGKFLHKSSTGLQEVDWIGMGFTLIKRGVFRRMFYPWWRERVETMTVDGIAYAANSGDDVGFCIGAREAGYKIYCDCDCAVEHLTEYKGG